MTSLTSFAGVPDGLLDTNVFVHALMHDEHTEEARRFLELLGKGAVRAYLHPLEVQELTYVLGRVMRQMSRDDIASYAIGIMALPGVLREKQRLERTLRRWASKPGFAFVDAYLAAWAIEDGAPL